MTLDDLSAALAQMPPEAPLIFDAPSGRSAPGYHVTELKLSDVSAIDCAGRRAAWQEAVVQILDGQGGRHMQVRKFRAIAGRSAAAVAGLGAQDLKVEFGAGNARLELLAPRAPRLEAGAVIVPLGPQRAQCKPAQSLGSCG